MDDWTRRLDGSSGVGVLIRLRDEGSAVEQENDALLVSWASHARLTSDELRYAGLPDPAPYVLEILAGGAISNANFNLRYGFLQNDRRVIGVKREGTWLQVGDRDFLLLDPLYSIVCAIDEFRRSGKSALESKMLRWGRIAEMLPQEAVVDGTLRSLKIAVASSFRLDPSVNAVGEPDFDPVVGRREIRPDDTGAEEQAFVDVLSPDEQAAFARRFRGFSRVRHRYPLGNGAYIVLTKEVESALGVVRRAQNGTPDERRDFLKNVSGHLKETLLHDGREKVEVDEIFSDDGLSERVSGVGIWIDKVLPWAKQLKQPWMPPEEFGLRIGPHYVQILRDDFPDLLAQAETAKARGDRSVPINGINVPLTDDTVKTLEDLARRSQFHRPTDHGTRSRTEKEADDNQVLIVIDNLNEIGFRRERKRRKALGPTPRLETKLLPHQEEGLA